MSKLIIIKPKKQHREEVRLMYWIRKLKLERVGVAYIIPDTIPNIEDLIAVEIEVPQATTINQADQNKVGKSTREI